MRSYVTLDNCADPLLHFAMVKNNVGLAPLSTADAQWKEVRPDTAGWLSATGYFFGRELRKTLNVPVGIINDNWGGTPAQAWMSRGALEANPDFKHYLDEEAAYAESYPRMLDNFNAKQASYLASKAAGTVGTAPAKPDEPAKWKAGAAHLYNGMIAPVIPYGIKGAIWYQGESNAGRAFEYRTLFPALIADWRKNWGEGEFPFLYVQLAPTYAISPKPVDGSGWAEIREAQRLTLATVPNTAMAVITDVGDQNTVHPKRKEPVGHRLALAARALVYMENTECTGPVLRGASVDGSKIRVSFTHAQGLHAIEVHDVADNGPMLAGADKLAGFEIAGADRKYHAADAAIDGTSVVVSSPDVPTPVAVRYAWANYPVANLSNGAGLPASPFKTDDWPWSTQPKP